MGQDLVDDFCIHNDFEGARDVIEKTLLRTGWLALIWIASVSALAVAALAIRVLKNLTGMTA